MALLPHCGLRITHFTPLFTAFCVICTYGLLSLRGQELPAISTTPPVASTGDGSVEITADGQNTYLGNIATADDNVVLRYKSDVIFADHMIYDRSTKTVTALGNVRIFSGTKVYRGSSIVYNLETKAMTSSAFYGEEYPKFVTGKQVTTPEPDHYRLTNATFTTDNRANPSFHMAASTIEYRPNDEVVLKNVLIYVGNVPVFYVPIFVQSLNDSRPAYQFQVGNSGRFGSYIDNTYNWVADNKLRGSTEFDVREKRGYAGGVDVQYFPSLTSDILLKTYYAQDNLYSKSYNGINKGNQSDQNVFDGVPYDNRYRVAYEHHLQFSNDFSSIADLNFWSDPWITRDFFSGEYQGENQPPNFISLNEYNPNFTLSLLASPQVNPFFETVERLPEFMAEVKQQKIFGTDIQYSNQSSVVNFDLHYADTSKFSNPSNYIYNSFPVTNAYTYYHPNATYSYNPNSTANYNADRYDTYHEFSYPHQYFNFLSLTPRIGGRFTYYSDETQDLGGTLSKARLAGDVGLEGDFKISRTWLNVASPNLGINGIRHVVEPFFNAQYAPSPTVTPNEIHGFDNRLYSTQLQPINWTEYNSIDSIDKQAVLRFGVWNKIQTKRDGLNYDLITLQTYADADFDRNFSSSTPNSTLSNLFNNLVYAPTKQLQFNNFSAIDVSGGGYNQVDTNVTWSPDPSLQLTVGDHYINHSPIFSDSNNIAFGMFYRLNEHWQLQAQEQFEAVTGRLQLQEYTITRDLDSWQAALSYSNSEFNGQNNQTVYFSLTLKAFPQYQLRTPRM